MKRPRRQRRQPLHVRIPQAVIDYFLTERGRTGAIDRFTQDGSIVSDVWYAFGEDLSKPVRVLVAPIEGVRAVDVASVLYDGIADYRRSDSLTTFQCVSNRISISISPLDNFVWSTMYLDELLRVALPLTGWWSRQGLGYLGVLLSPTAEARQPRTDLRSELRGVLRDEIMARLRNVPKRRLAGPDRQLARNIADAAPVAGLIGLMMLAARDASIVADIQDERDLPSLDNWAFSRAEQIADAAVEELTLPLPAAISHFYRREVSKAAPGGRGDEPWHSPSLIHRVFLDRESKIAASEGNCTIKADAAQRVFNVSCRNITWAIIDCGIDATHPAFANHDPDGPPRIKAILDFTVIDRIRSIALAKASRADRKALIDETITALKALPDYPSAPSPDFEKMAHKNLNLIAEQLGQRLQPDWALIEPLISRRAGGEDEEQRPVVSNHATHVAGILGADWREGGETVLQGVCPDINLYDLRVISATASKSTEFAVLAALEYIAFANRRSLGTRQIIHGVNVSLQIPHAVRTYACGATPICVGCNNLVGSGVVVVAAAGNRGWNEQEAGFGTFTFCSITDPGNAEDVITVGSTHRQRPHTYGVSFFSSRGPTGDGRVKPDLVAPGEKINGPIPDRSSDELDGTSMAAPFVSGAAAMLIARNNELIGNPRRIKQILCDSATDLGRERYFQGHGLLDVLRALQSL